MSKNNVISWLTEELDVSRETIERLEKYAVALEKWAPKINLVSKSTIDDLWDRHILDSAQIWKNMPQNARKWADLGSGAGFPGLVLAIIAAERAPQLEIYLVESDTKKCSFLRTVARETGISIKILNERVEKADLQGFDVVSARALASLSQLFAYSKPILDPKGICVFLKGQGYATELEEAREKWSFGVETIPSMTSSDARILVISDLKNVE